MSALDYAALTTQAIVEAFEGREMSGASRLRDALRILDDKAQKAWKAQGEAMGLPVEGIEALLLGPVRDRIAFDAAELGKTKDEIDAFLGRSPGVSAPKKRSRSPDAVLAPHTDNATLRELLFTQLDKGPLSTLALSRRTGATKDRVAEVLGHAAQSAPPLAKLNGLKWSLVKP